MIAVLIVSGGLMYFLALSGRSRLAIQAPQGGPWHDLAWRTEQIHNARSNEVVSRWLEMARQATGQRTPGGNGQHPTVNEPVRDAANNRRS